MGRSLSKIQFRLDGDGRKKPRLYDVCGLQGVYLLNGYRVEQHEGEEYVSVIDVGGLHRAIARHLVFTRKGLAPAEVRFIRKALELTQASLATKLGVNAQSVARWEKAQCEMPATAEKLLRILFLIHTMTRDDTEALTHMDETLDELDQLDDLTTHQASFKLEDTWIAARKQAA